MTRLTIAEKILSEHAGGTVRAGDICVCEVDRALGTDGSTPMAIDYFEEMGGSALHDPQRIVYAMDHYAPHQMLNPQSPHRRVREFARTMGGLFYGPEDGVGHQLMVEKGHVSPGGLYLGADSHSVMYGALNCFAAGIGSSDLAAVMLTGSIWLQAPSTQRIEMTGRLSAGVCAKDLALWMTGRLGGDGAPYQALEFGGEGLAGLDMSDRLTIANMVAECGAKAGIFDFDAATADYARAAGAPAGRPTVADEGCCYADRIEIDLASLPPLVALPHAPGNVRPISEAIGNPVDLVYLGTCTSGRLKDFHEALAVLEARGGVRQGVKAFVTPASLSISRMLEADGSAERFRRQGAIMMSPGCGACCGTDGVIPFAGARVISTANRNFRGRMGERKAEITLASPLACAAAAAVGHIVDPRGPTA